MITRRSGCFFVILMIAFAGMILRTFNLSMGENAVMARKVAENRQCSLPLYHTKGLIYDCDLRPMAGAQPCDYLVINPRKFDRTNTQKLADITGEKKETISEKLKKESPFVLKCSEVPETMVGVSVFEGVSRYSGLASHLLGYLDRAGEVGLAGAEKEFDPFLSLFSTTVSVEYEADALGGMIPEEGLNQPQGSQTKNGLILTLDRSLCAALEDAMDRNIEKGAAVILDCKTGEIKALCSRPTYDEACIADFLNSSEGELINRALASQTVGSVFKIILAACALEQGLEDYSYNCTGGIMISGQVIACHDHGGHGEVGLKDAFSNSCNSYFIALGQMLGSDKIEEMAARFGFGSSIEILGSIAASRGNLPQNAVGLSLGNLSIGQGDLMASPLQIAKMTAIIANGGALPTITAYKGLYLNGTVKEIKHEQKINQIISKEHAEILREFCIDTVENGTGKEAKPAIGSAGGKTSSAQTGIIREGKEQLNVYFTGFYPANDPQYVITIFAEDGVSGGKTCGPIFREVCNFIAENFLTP